MLENAVILDIKGCCQYAMHRGRDPDSVLNDKDKPVNSAAYGINGLIETYLLPALEMVRPWQIIAVWDGGNDLRRGWYPSYKQKRAEREKDSVEEEQYEELYKLAKNLLAGLGCTQVRAEMTEADDLIALLCRQLPGTKAVYTVDADLLQLAAVPEYKARVFLRDQLITDEYKGVPLHLLRLHKSMVGDKSDGYVGIRGFGDAAWDGMVKLFGTDGMEEMEQCVASGDYTVLEEAIEATEGGTQKSLQKVYDARQDWALMYQLAGLHPDLCFRTQKGKVIKPVWFKRVPDRDRFCSVLRRVGCLDLLEQFEGYLPDQALVTTANLDAMYEHFCSEVAQSPLVAFDFETYDDLKHPDFQKAQSKQAGEYVDVLSQKVTGASFTYGVNLQYTVYLSVNHRDTANVPKQAIADFLAQVPPEKLAVHNAAFETLVSELDLGFEMDAPLDTMILHCHTEEDDRHSLKHLSKKFLNYDQATYKETLGERADMRELSGEEVEQYGCDDATVTAHLAVLFVYNTLLEGTWEQIRTYEFPVVHVLNRGFEKGVNVDIPYLQAKGEEEQAFIDTSLARMRELLAEHCAEPNQENALRYFDDIVDFERAKRRHAGKEAEKITQELNDLRATLIERSQYQPLREVAKKVDFKPTKKQLGDIAEALGIEQPFPNPSASAITNWLVTVREAWVPAEVRTPADPLDIPPMHPEPEPPTSEAGQFVQLLADAAGEIRKREGEAYEALEQWCAAFMGEAAGTELEGDTLNFDSHADNTALLYCKLGIPIRVRTQVKGNTLRFKLGYDGGPATDDKAVETALAEDYPAGTWQREVLELMRQVKAAQTRFKLYYRPYPLWQHPRDGYIHPQIKNCGTVTHRPSGASPNFLQITKKDGGTIRKAIRGHRDDHIIISPDFAGQELRILASESRDPVLMDAYLPPEGQEEKDIHSLTGTAIAPILLERRLPQSLEQFQVTPTGLVYEEFMAALNGEHEALVKELKDVRKNAKGVNFLINYLGRAGTLSRNLGIPQELAQVFIDRTFRRYPRIQPWQEEVMRFAEIHGYTETAYGTRRHLTDDIVASDGFVRSRMQRQAVNFVVQGCLQAGSRVWTEEGPRPIEGLVNKPVTVWTGFKWAQAVGVDMGEAQLARITLSSGLTIDCDTRHKLKNDQGEWVSFEDLKEGTHVALPKLQSEGVDPTDYSVDWAFVVGYWLGDGCLTTRKGSRPTDSHYRGTLTLVGGKTKRKVLLAVCTFLNDHGLTAQFSEVTRQGRETLFKVTVHKKTAITRLREWGISESTALDKKIPERIWSANKAQQMSFLKGYLMADGSRKQGFRVHTPNAALLDDLQKFAAWLQLDTWRGQSATGEYVEFRKAGRSLRLFPATVVRGHLEEAEISLRSRRGDCEAIVEKRAVGQDFMAQHVAERIYDKHLPDMHEVYRFDTVEKVEILEETATTYTLSVDDPLHQYVADGVIQKNCAAQILKIVLTEIRRTRLMEETCAIPIAPVYDELAASVPMAAAVEYVGRLSEIMTITPPGHPIPMKPEVALGSTWGEMVELGAYPSVEALEEALDKIRVARRAVA